MKKLIMTAAIIIASTGIQYAQTYQYDFQKSIGIDEESVKNYTLCETQKDGFALVSFLESDGSSDQNKIQIFKTDSDLNVILSQKFEYNSVGLYGFEITPFDIYETKTGGFIICGKIINEGNPAKSGGFLLSIKNTDDILLSFNWMQIYPSENIPGIMPVQQLTRVVETDDGYIAIARGDNFLSKGIVLKTDFGGKVQWTKHLFDEEYKGNKYSVLNDMVLINGEEVAIVGTVNSFPQDDADVNVVLINTVGDIISNNVYEFIAEADDKKYTYLERGTAIEYNEEKEELIIAGTIMKKREGVCVAAEYKNILTFGVNYSTGSVNWSTRHDIGADPTIANESIYCADIDFGKDEYAVTGTVKNHLFAKTANYNGFILRLDGEANNTNLRYYGLSGQDFLNRIYNKGEKYIAGGTINRDGNRPWLIESYNSIISDCKQKTVEAITEKHPLIVKKGESIKVEIRRNETEIKEPKTSYTEELLCKKILVKGGIHAPQHGDTDLTSENGNVSVVYPTIMENGVLNIVNNTELITFSLYSIQGNSLIQEGQLLNGLNTVEFTHLNSGVYIVVCKNETGEQEIFKVIKR